MYIMFFQRIAFFKHQQLVFLVIPFYLLSTSNNWFSLPAKIGVFNFRNEFKFIFIFVWFLAFRTF